MQCSFMLSIFCLFEQDPELMAAFKDPDVMAALQDGTFASFMKQYY